MLLVCIIPLIILLAFTKYFYLIRSSLFNANTIKLIIPAGISFYTLKLISTHIEIYKGRLKVPSLIDYAVYISMFTQILSGPVMRMNDFEVPEAKFDINSESFRSGAFLLAAGLFKKLIVANMASGYVNSVHQNILGSPALALWMSAFLYSMELYADFSGYSDISNGIMKLMGFRETPNFNAPYFSGNIKEFWNRWHISFSSWLRDYVYIPLGGSRCSGFRKFINIMITFLVSGIWHGTGINFIIWGILHGLLVYFSSWRNNLLTFILAIFLWIPFRAANFTATLNYCSHMFRDLAFSLSDLTRTILLFTNDNTCVIYAAVLFTGIALMLLYDFALTHDKDYSGAFLFMFLSMIILFGKTGNSAFIYAQF